MSYEQKQNKTREVILSAFISLLHEKPFSKVTVGDIAEKANINRGTFYKYYNDKYQLVEKIEAQIVSELEETNQHWIAENQAGNAGNDDVLVKSIVATLEVFERHADFINVMLSENGDAGFERVLLQHTIEFERETMPLPQKNMKGNDEIRELIVHYQASALIGVVVYWLRNLNIPPQDLANLILSTKRKGTYAICDL